MDRSSIITRICNLLNWIFSPSLINPQEAEKRCLQADKETFAELEKMLEARREELSEQN